MDHEQNQNGTRPSDRAAATTSEPVRFRWTPRPEQIQILENIFNSGTVNPAKDETTKIRKILERYGSVGDANVFYWFQNRRSMSRRHQRQMQAAAAAAGAYGDGGGINGGPVAGSVLYEPSSFGSSSASSNSSGSGFLSYCPSSSVTSSSSSPLPGFIGDDGCADDLFSISRQMGHNIHDNAHNPGLYSDASQQLPYQSGE